MRALARAARDVCGGGRFVSVWSVAASLVLSFTVMAVPGEGASPALWLALAASWVCFAAALMLIGVAERALRTTRARATAVIAGVVVIAAVRPSLQDAWLHAVGAQSPPTAELPFRVLTNVVVWAVVLAAIAIIVDAWRSLRATNALLRAVVADLDAAQERAIDYGRRAHGAVEEAATVLRAAVAQLAGHPRAPEVLGARLRERGHGLAALAEEEHLPGPAGPPADRRGGVAVPVLRVPPRGAVAVLYAACFAPYVVHSASLVQLAPAVVLLVGGGAAADRMARGPAIRRTASPVTFVAFSAVVGLGLSALAFAQGFGLPLALVPAAVYIALTVSLSLCAGALRTLRVEQRRLSGAVTARQRIAASATAADRAALRRAADLLHRDGQGACVLFTLEHPHPDGADLARLVAVVGDAVDRMTGVFATPAPGVDARALDALLQTWARVVELRVEIDDSARAALDADPVAASEVYEIVAEGLLNAAKHDRARIATVALSVVATGAGPRLRVWVLTPGPVAPDAELRPASRARALGAELRAGADGARVEAHIRWRAAQGPSAVVSAEHPTASSRPTP